MIASEKLHGGEAGSLEAHAMDLFRRSVFSLFLGAVILAVAATPVWATVTKSGYKGCTVNQTGYTHSRSTGLTEHYPPGGGYRSWQNGGSYTDRTGYSNVAGGGSWHVDVTSGSLDDANTYAGCVNGTP
jgi:hypothetical protein